MTSCPACGAPDPPGDTGVVFVADDVPAQLSRVFSTADEARTVPRGRLEIVACDACGLARNRAFDPSLVVYDADYVDSQAHSAVFTDFVDRITDELVGHLGRPPREVLEVGSGSGDVLRRMCARLGVPGVGYDPVPAAPAAPGAPDPRGVRFVEGSFGADVDPGRADVVVCRHTLEHVEDPGELLAAVARSMSGRHALVYVEVPDAEAVLAARAFWDVYHEHVHYFGRRSLEALLEGAGLVPLEVRSDYGGQYLVAFALSASGTPAVGRDPAPPHRADPGAWRRLAAARDAWRAAAGEARGARLVIWGATSRTTQLLAAVDELEVVALCDVNPAKWGRFLPGVGEAVVPPAGLASVRPDLVLAANPLYVDEIAAEAARHGVRVPVVGLTADPPDLTGRSSVSPPTVTS